MYKVSPPFESNLQVFLFLFILIVLLASPLIPTMLLGMKPSEKYQSVPLKYSNYHFIGEEMELGGEIDVLFIGSSDAWTAFNAPYISKMLSKDLGRKVRVSNFGTNWFGAESYYIRLKDTLEVIKPKVVVMPDSSAGANYPHELTHFVWSEPQQIPYTAISLRQRLTLYGAGLLGSPYQTYAKLVKIWEKQPRAQWVSSLKFFRDNDGFMGEENGWLSHWDPDRDNRSEYKEITYEPTTLSIEEMTYTNQKDEKFEDLHYKYNKYQTFFIKKMAEITNEMGAKFITVSIPTHFKEGKVLEKSVYRHLHDNEVKSWLHIGISMTDLFHGSSYKEMTPFYSNESHLNKSGATVFSQSLVPILKKELE